MILTLGSTGQAVKDIQAFLQIPADGDYGPQTKQAVMSWQQQNRLTPDGIAGPMTIAQMQQEGLPQLPQPPAAPYENVTIQGSTFPGAPYESNMRVTLNADMQQTYLPALNATLANDPKGLKLLLTIMASNEGFFQGSRSYRTNNPGNIGNTDGGGTQTFSTLAQGIQAQKNYVEGVVSGQNNAYPMNREVNIAPYYSPEIAANQATYGMSPWLPGYQFVFTGQLDQYVKIYSTGARGGNSYINQIVSYFNENGLSITPQSKIQDIIQMN